MATVNINHLIWSRINTSPAPIKLYTSEGKVVEIAPGERIILPKQVEFLQSMLKYDAVLFGGAAGPGKSFILRWALIWFCMYLFIKYKIRGAEVGLFCESYTALEDRHIGEFRRMPEWLGVYHEKAKEFRISPKFGGGVVKLRNLDDPVKYSSAQFAAIAVDELTLNTEATFNFLRTRLRWMGVEHCPFIAATNPGSIGHNFCYERFVNPETRVKAHYDEELDYWSKGYHFIKALPQDNPFLTKQYRADLKRLPDKLRKALVEGDWSTFMGQFFNLEPAVHKIKPFDIPPHWSRWRALDSGFAHPTVCLWGATDERGNLYVYREWSQEGMDLVAHKRIIAQMSGDERYRLTVGDPKMFSSESSIAGNKLPSEVFNDMYDDIGSFYMTPANNDRMGGWMALRNGFAWEGEVKYRDDGTQEITVTTPPKIFIFDTCVCTWNSLTTIVHDDVKVEDVKKTKGYYKAGQGDDEADTLRYMYMAIMPSVTLTQSSRRSFTHSTRNRVPRTTRSVNSYF